MIEITGSGEQPEEEAAQEKVSNITENLQLHTGEVRRTVCICKHICIIMGVTFIPCFVFFLLFRYIPFSNDH